MGYDSEECETDYEGDFTNPAVEFKPHRETDKLPPLDFTLPSAAFKWECGDHEAEHLPTLGYTGIRPACGTPNMLGSENMRPVDIFLNMIGGKETIQRAVDTTNAKHDQWQNAKGQVAADENEDDRSNPMEAALSDHRTNFVYGVLWKTVTYTDILMFLTICMTMTMIGLAEAQEFWCCSEIGLIPAFMFGLKSGMSYHRWRQIKKFFTFGLVTPEDLNTEGPRKGKPKDKLVRCRWLIVTLARTFEMYWKPGQRYCVDESMIPYTGRMCPVKTFCPDKPHKYGIKVWCLNDSKKSYCQSFKIYEGAEEMWPGESVEQYNEWGQGERVILNLTKDIPQKSYVFCDRLFTTPKLCAFMRWVRNLFLTGTMKSRVKGMSKQTMFKESDHYPRGFYLWAVDRVRKVLQMCWMDRKPVLLCSNIHGADRAGGVKRLTAHGKGMSQSLIMFYFTSLLTCLLVNFLCRWQVWSQAHALPRGRN